MADKKIPRWKTPERIAYMKAWQKANRDKGKVYSARRRAKNPGADAAYYQATRERQRKQRAAYYQANRLRIIAKVKKYYQENRGKVLEYHTEHYKKNAARISAETVAYRKANPALVAATAQRRRVRKFGNGGVPHTMEDKIQKFALLGNVCFYCGKSETHIDHDIPLSRGGTDDIRNILPSCRSCNSSKNAKTAAEYLNHRRRK